MSEPRDSGVNPWIWVVSLFLAMLAGAFMFVGWRSASVVLPPVVVTPVAPPPAEEPPEVSTEVAPPPKVEEQPSLGQRYKTAMEHMDRGEYAKAYSLLVEVKEVVEEEELQLNPATRKELDRRLKEAIEKMREAPKTPEPPAVDGARLEKVTAMAQKYADAQALMKQKDYAGALKLFLDVQAAGKELGDAFADSDRTVLERNIAACRERLQAAP